MMLRDQSTVGREIPFLEKKLGEELHAVCTWCTMAESACLSIPGPSSVEALILPNLSLLTLLFSVFHYSEIFSSLFMVLSVLTFHSEES